MTRSIRKLKILENVVYLNNGDLFPGSVYPILNYSSDKILTVSNFRKMNIMDVSGGDKRFTLPAATFHYLGEWLIVVRSGTNHELLIQAAGTNVIFNSEAGGSLICEDTDHDYSSVLLVIMAVGVWGNPTFGIWSSR